MNKLAVLKNKKGFTLVEIIVVLVILAILAVAGIPSMIGFIDEARGKAYIAEARVGLIAAQMIMTESEGGYTTSTLKALITATTAPSTEPDKTRYAQFKSYTSDCKGSFTDVTVSDKQVTGITYRSKTATPYYLVTITSDGTTVEKKTT